jgi:uncharacterized protein (TIGR02001 family)
MKTLSKAVAIASLLSAGLMGAQVANAEVSFNAALVTDYVFRGVSYSDNGLALQGGADYAHESGVYVGTWLSNIDTGIDTDIEYDLYVGYGMEVNGLEIDLGYTTYNYVDLDQGNTTEIYANVTKGAITASVYRDIDLYDSTYLGFAYSMELPQDLALDLTAGYTLVDADDEDDIYDVSATVSKSLEMVDVAFTVTNVDGDAAGVEDDTLFFLSVSKEF